MTSLAKFNECSTFRSKHYLLQVSSQKNMLKFKTTKLLKMKNSKFIIWPLDWNFRQFLVIFPKRSLNEKKNRFSAFLQNSKIFKSFILVWVCFSNKIASKLYYYSRSKKTRVFSSLIVLDVVVFIYFRAAFFQFFILFRFL